MKTVYYTDPLNDDFAGTKIITNKVGADFNFAPKSAFWRACAAVVYYGIAALPVWLADRIWMGARFENRKILKEAKDTGYFIYGNHTQIFDAFTPSMSAFPKKAYIIAGPDAVSIKGLRCIVQMLGCIPLPNERAGMVPFMKAVEQRWREGGAIMIFPEAHIWPYYNGIRPFKETSFRYPARLGSPVFAAVAVYRKRKFFKRPAVTIRLEGPFYPDLALNEREAAKKLRDEVYERMCRVVEERQSVEYIRYVQKGEEK